MAVLLSAAAAWVYDPRWTSGQGRDLDEIARRVAPDIFSIVGSKLAFDPGFSSPCWHNSTSILCLPSFYVAGGFQCGARDLTMRLGSAEKLAQPRKRFVCCSCSGRCGIA